MSLTSYRAAPSRDKIFDGKGRMRSDVLPKGYRLMREARAGHHTSGGCGHFCIFDIVMGFTGTFILHAPATKPGDVLLFQRLSGSTIGADRFHGRVRDGIGWVTVAMATKL